MNTLKVQYEDLEGTVWILTRLTNTPFFEPCKIFYDA